MNSFLFLVILCSIYYGVFKYYPQYIEDKYNYYFGGFISLWFVIRYMFSYESELMNKMLRNIYDTSRQPLYSFNAKDSNAELYNSLNPNQDIKSMLSEKQGNRCAKCQNYIMRKDIEYYKLRYLIPMERGGRNEVNNLGIVCPNCMF